MRSDVVARFGCAVLIGMVFSLPVQAETTPADIDIVEFGAGSRLVGEVKYLDRGKLYFKTDTTDTIPLDWIDVKALVSAQKLSITRRNSAKILGSLVSSSAPGVLAIVTPDQKFEVPLSDVVHIRPIEETLWEQLDIELEAGYAFTKSTEVEQWNVGANIDHETEDRIRRLVMNTQNSKAKDQSNALQANIDYQTIRYRRGHWGTGWGAGFERNDSLSLSHRASGLLLAGVRLFPAQGQRLRFTGGLQINNESFDSGESVNSIEGYGSIIFDWYRFSDPELDLTTNLVILPSLSESGRWRSSLDISLKWEIYEDFFWKLSFYNDYDSQAIDNNTNIDANNNDYGIRTTFGWSN